MGHLPPSFRPVGSAARLATEIRALVGRVGWWRHPDHPPPLENDTGLLDPWRRRHTARGWRGWPRSSRAPSLD